MGVLEGQVAIVTGGGQGVGRGVALAVAAEGAKVAVLGRTMSKCEAVAAEIADRGGEAFADGCDVEQRDQIEASVARTVGRWGRVDLVVNSAQSTAYASLRRLTDDEMTSMWLSGPLGTFRMMQACFPHLRETAGSVVNMGSGSSILPQPTMAGYAMAKEACRILARVGALEWGRYGIRVNSICPLAATPGFDNFDATTGAGEQVEEHIPLGRLGDPEADIGRAVVYLASDAGKYVTGTTLMVDGGFSFLR